MDALELSLEKTKEKEVTRLQHPLRFCAHRQSLDWREL
jgi:hypothetical protein